MVQAKRSVGRYDVVEEIGRGGAAVVYLAYQRDLRRRVALKELLSQHLADPNFAERFVEESWLAGAMSHASIVTVHEYFEHDGIPYIAMEYLSRGSLRPYVGRLSVPQIIGVLESVLAGLSHGESQRVVHRDLKPENLLVAADGRVKIADFGVARAYNVAAPRAVVTVTGTTIGTPAYMAPEQALGETLTPATDLYSLGIVAWELLTGSLPFASTDTPVSVLYRHVHEPVPRASEVDPEIDERLAGWLDQMLAKRPEDRFHNAELAWDALEDIVIDLLGPRWRREARLGAGPAEPGAHPLTPARFDTEAAEEAESPAPEEAVSPAAEEAESPAAEEAEAPAAEKTVGGSARVRVSRNASGENEAPAANGSAVKVPEEDRSPAGAASSEEPPEDQTPPAPVPAARGRETILRPGRRHHPPEDGAATVEKRSRRRAVVATLAAVTVLGAGAGVVAGVVTGGRSSDRTTHARTTNAPPTLDQKLTRVLATLATARANGLAADRAAHTPAEHAAAVGKIGDAYRAAAAHILELPGSASTSLYATVTNLADAYSRLAQLIPKAAKGGSVPRAEYQNAQADIARNEQQLRTEAAKL